MGIRDLMGYAATAVLACASGWWMHDGSAEPAAAANAASPQANTASPTKPAAASQVQGALIAVASDGNVTLRVEQQPLEWVLDEIARQSGWDDVHRRAGVKKGDDARVAAAPRAEAAVPAGCGADAFPTAPQTERVMHAILRGSESDRFDGLLQARADGVALDDDTLRRIVETDASEPVRLLAFESLLDGRNADPAALRSALEAALNLPSAAVQREAQRRLDELRELERAGAAAPQSGPD